MLKGKTIIELTDVNTGEKEVIEENNMVTNAINDLFNTFPNLLNAYSIYRGGMFEGYGNSLDFIRLYEFLLGGILLFDSQIEEKPENTEIKKEPVKKRTTRKKVETTKNDKKEQEK